MFGEQNGITNSVGIFTITKEILTYLIFNLARLISPFCVLQLQLQGTASTTSRRINPRAYSATAPAAAAVERGASSVPLPLYEKLRI